MILSPERLDELMADLRPGAGALARRPKPGCAESALGNAAMAASYALGSDAADPLVVAAYLLRSLARNHCYEDGNKRIAWMATLEYLWVTAGCGISAEQEEAAAIVVRVAEGAMGVPELVAWLAGHVCAA